MKKNVFLFIKDTFFTDFEFTDKIPANKESGSQRPCFFVFKDKKEPDIYWCVPISSKTEKYEAIVEDKLQKQWLNGNDNPECDTIRFASVLGQPRAFLIQNMFPVLDTYVDGVYYDKNTNKPVTISDKEERDICSKAKKVLHLVRSGYRDKVFPDIIRLQSQLIQHLRDQEKQAEAEITISEPVSIGTNAKTAKDSIALRAPSMPDRLAAAAAEADRRNAARSAPKLDHDIR